MPTTTLQQLKLDILAIFSERDEVLTGLSLPLATSADGTTTTIKDTSLKRGTTGVNRYNGREVEILEQVTGGPAVGETSRVTDGGFDGTDTLTVAPAFSAIVQGGGVAGVENTDYIMYPRGLSKENLEREINAVLRNTEGVLPWFPSLVPDADFDSNDTANWTAVGAPPTRVFTTTAATETLPAEYLFGERSLEIIANAADQGAQSNIFAVTERETLLIYCITQTTVNSLKVELYNDTSNAVAATLATVDEFTWTEVRKQETVPDNMEEARIRFILTANLSSARISPPVVVQATSHARPYPAPSWLVSPAQVRGAFYISQGTASEAADSYIALSRELVDVDVPELFRWDRALDPMHFLLRGDSRGPVGLNCYRPFATLSTNGATTPCDREYIVAKAMANLLKKKGDKEWRDWADSAAVLARGRGYGGRDIIMRENVRVGA